MMAHICDAVDGTERSDDPQRYQEDRRERIEAHGKRADRNVPAHVPELRIPSQRLQSRNCRGHGPEKRAAAAECHAYRPLLQEPPTEPTHGPTNDSDAE